MKILKKKQPKRPFFTEENKEEVLKKAKNNAAYKNKKLVGLAHAYSHFEGLDFDNSNMLLNLCHHHTINPRILEYMDKSTSAHLVRFANTGKFRTNVPKEFTCGKFDLEETIESFRLLKVACESFDLQTFYNTAKSKGYINSESDELLFDKISSNLTGVNRHFIHQLVDKTQNIEPVDYVVGPAKTIK